MSSMRSPANSSIHSALNTLINKLDAKASYFVPPTSLKDIKSTEVKNAISQLVACYRSDPEQWAKQMDGYLTRLSATQLFNLTYYVMSYDFNQNNMILRSSSKFTTYLYQHCYKTFQSIDNQEMACLNSLVYQSMQGQGLQTSPDRAAANAISFTLGFGAVASDEFYNQIAKQLVIKPEQLVIEEKQSVPEHKISTTHTQAIIKLAQTIQALNLLKSHLTNELKSTHTFFTPYYRREIKLKAAKIAFIRDLVIALQQLQNNKQYDHLDADIEKAINTIINKKAYQSRGITLTTVLQGRFSHRTNDILSNTLGPHHLESLKQAHQVHEAHPAPMVKR